MRRMTVAALARELDRMLGRTFPRVCIEGEISQINTPSSGHAYLTLRDGDVTLACVVWRNDWRQIRKHPVEGDRVACFGRVGIYPGQSRYQLYAHRVEPAGEGKLERQLAEIRKRLAEDGLLDPRRRRPLPKVPGVVGLVTSPTGAALQDFLRVSRQRWPAARILLAGATVQGPEAPSSIVRALELLYQDHRADVVVVTRGGGSRLDLLPFHDEQVARWIATSPVPIVSAVGHEIDTTIADEVADAVAPTPSAAAVLVLPDGPALAQRLDEAEVALGAAWSRGLSQRRRRLAELRQRLRHPRQVLAGHRQRLGELASRLEAAGRRRVERARTRTDALQDRLRALSPLAVLGRGYALVRGPHGVLTRASDAASGEILDVHLAEGSLRARVEPES